MNPMKRYRSMFLFLVALIGLLAFVTAQAIEEVAGTWQGAIEIPGSPLEVIVAFSDEEGALTGTIDIPAQGAVGLPLEVIAVENEQIRFVIVGIPGEPTFLGSLEDERLVGDFTQGGQTFPFTLERGEAADAGMLEPAPDVAAVEALLGHWQGVIDPDGFALTIGVTFEDVGGLMTGEYTIPAQGVAGALRLLEANEEGVAFMLEGVPGNATFEGAPLNGALDGTFTQAGMSLALRFERADEPLTLRRPQDPVPPYPYREEEVSYASADGVRLAATLTLPEGEGPFPALLLLTGSGPQDRNEELFNHRPFLVIADHLTRAGFAVLRADDRGVGESGGVFNEAGFEDFVADALAGLAFLQERPELDPTRLGLLGHSEGGYIAPLAARAFDGELAFVITLAGPSVPGLEVLELQNRLILEAAGASEEEVEAQVVYIRELAALLEAGEIEAAERLTRERIEASFAEMPDAPPAEAIEATIAAQQAGLRARWFQDFFAFDPTPSLLELGAPLLAIYGGRDLQVPPSQSVPALEALAEEMPAEVTIEVFDELNHLLQPAETGAIEEYGQIETTIAPEVLDLISEWLRARVLD